MGDVFFWNNPLVEKENFNCKMADSGCITNSDISLLVVNCDWLIHVTQHSILVERCFIGAVGNSIVN